MEKILRIPFTEIDTADLLVDAVYEGGTAKNLGSEVLSKVMHVGNSGGFRKCMKLGENGKKAKDVAYVCIYTTGEEIEWRDEIDRTVSFVFPILISDIYLKDSNAGLASG